MEEFEVDREALLAAFMGEAEECLGRMEQMLVAMEASPGEAEVLNTIFRDAHTLKGGSALVGFDAVRDLAHDIEHVLERLRKHQLGVTSTLVTLLLRSVDVLRNALRDAAGGRVGPSEATAAFRASLAEAASAAASATSAVQPAQVAPSAQATPPAPAAPPAPASAPGPAGRPVEPADQAAPPTPAASGPSRTLRVDVNRLGKMLDLSGEIAVARGRLTEMLERPAAVSSEELLSVHREADRLYLDLQELIMKARMVPIGPIFYQHVRTVRDLSASEGKQAKLAVEGADVEVDTSVVEQIRDPLLHMVRNALDHGVERPEVRVAAGKPAQATLTLRAFHDAGSMVIEVVDDGAGLDKAKIARKAAALGIIEDPARATDEEIARAIFEPGFSTNDAVTAVSGRGVGMDVVRRNIQALRGAVSVTSEAGRGTTITVRVPLTLAIIQGFRVGVGGQPYILPLDAIVECLELPAEHAGGEVAGVMNVRGKPLPFLRLRSLFGIAGAGNGRENVVVLRHGTTTTGLAVDTLHGESSTVIKPLGALFRSAPGVAGSSIMGDGRVALILDVGGLLREALRRTTGAADAAVAARGG